MYCAKQRAVVPFTTFLPATVHVGRAIVLGSLACLASAAIATGVMSPLPTICSCLMLSRTVVRPLTPMMIATIPNAIRMAPAATPPHSSSFLIACSLPLGVMRGVSAADRRPPSGQALTCAAELAPVGRGIPLPTNQPLHLGRGDA